MTDSQQVDPLGAVTRFGCNTVLRAGAGTGKTEALTTLYLHLILGATENPDPLPPRHLVAMTFTEKAATEMRQRIREHLTTLASNNPERWRGYPRLMRALEPRGGLDRHRVTQRLRDLQTARITTISAFCARLLREHSSTLDLPQDFRILDEMEAQSLLHQSAQEELQAALEQRNPQAIHMLNDLGQRTSSTTGGWLQQITSIALSVLEGAVLEGASPQTHVAPPKTESTPAHAARLAWLHGFIQTTLTRYAQHKQVRDVLDFSDLTRHTRDALKHHPSLRLQVQRDIQVLLVDEFQDTNTIQCELVRLLRQEEVPSTTDAATTGTATTDAATAHILRPKGLLLVGDRKQSIYGFRNADLTTFEGLAQQITREGGQEIALQTNYRSTAPLVASINVMAGAVLQQQSTFGFELQFDPKTETLMAASAEVSPTGSVPVEWLSLPETSTTKGSGVLPQAQAVAQRIRTMLDQGNTPVRDAASHVETRWRPATLSDVTVLLPRLTQAHVFLQELHNLNIPARILGGNTQPSQARQTQRDIIALVRLLLGVGTRLDEQAWKHGPFAQAPLASVTPTEVHHVGLAPWLQHLTKHAGAWQGNPVEQIQQDHGQAQRSVKQAQLSAMLLHAHQQQARGVHPLTVLQQWQQRLDRNLPWPGVQRVHPENGSEDSLQEVTLMTIHQSKGLQFPVVVAAEVGHMPPLPRAPVEFDPFPGAGLATAVRKSDGSWHYDDHHEHVHRVRVAREQAERMRLFYVQITRAMDALWLVGAPQQLKRSPIGKALQQLQDQALLTPTPFPQPPEITGPTDPTGIHPAANPTAGTTPSSAPSNAPWKPMGAAVAAADPPCAAQDEKPCHGELPVTQLADFLTCPRLFQLRRMASVPSHVPIQKEPLPAEHHVPLQENAIQRGNRMHAVLQHLDHCQTLDPDTTTAALEHAAHRANIHNLSPEEQATLHRFTQSPIGQRIARHPAHQTHREVPLVWTHREGHHRWTLRGQIDLLLETDEGLEIMDYKTGRGTGAYRGEYETQLALYKLALANLALAKLAPEQLALAQGASHISLTLIPLEHPEDSTQVNAAPLPTPNQILRSLTGAQQTGAYARLPQPQCQQLQCPYQGICYSSDHDPRSQLALEDHSG